MSLRGWVYSTTIIALTSLLGLGFVLLTLYDTPTTIILVFFLLFVIFSAGAVPLSVYLNYRFAGKDWRKRDRYRLLRHALGSGVLIVVVAYLQMERYLDWTIAAVLVSVFVLMETFFLTRS